MEHLETATSGYVAVEGEEESAEPEATVTVARVPVNPTAGMTKAQRKAYNREQRALEAARQAQMQQNSTDEEVFSNTEDADENPQG